MRRFIKAMFLLTVLVSLFFHISALSESGYTLTISPSGPIVLAPGESCSLSLAVQPVNLMQHDVYWSSQNEYVATVSAKGKVTAHAAGTTTITATIENGAKTRVTITVSGNGVKNLAILNPDLELEIGARAQLTYEMNSDADDKRVRWSSDDESVARVDGNGSVTAVGPGTAVITLLAVNGTTATARVYVPADVESIMVDPGELSIAPGDVRELDAYVFPGNARGREVRWTSSDERIASVNADGFVTAHQKGNCLIYASTANGVSRAVPVHVDIVPTGLTLSQPIAVLSKEARTILLQAEVLPAGVDCDLIWESSNESVAVVRKGLVCATGLGRATITVRAGNAFAAECEVYVCEPPTSVSFSESAYSLAVTDEPIRLSLTFEPANTYGLVSGWRVENPSIATIDENGILTPRHYGSTRVIVTCLGGLTATVNVNVYENAHALFFVRDSLTLNVGESAPINVISQTGDSVTNGVRWESSDPSVCAVVDGMLYGRSAGQVTVSASVQDGLVRADCTVTVNENPALTRKAVALTFDNGPGEYTRDILKVLEDYGVRATFFLLGANVEQAPSTAALLKDTPHEIGNHTYKNASLNTMAIAAIAADLERADGLILMATERPATILRAPDANLTARLFTTYLDTRRFAGWSWDSGDSQKLYSAQEIADRAMNEVFDTAILVFHDSGSETAQALTLLIPRLIAEGYDFVTVSELIEITGNTNAVFTTKRGN